MQDKTSNCWNADDYNICARLVGTCPYPSLEYPSANGTLCLQCPQYTFSSGLATNCSFCPIAQTPNATQSGCKNCEQGKTTNPPTELECQFCKWGYFLLNRRCQACPKGLKTADDHISCVPCQPMFNSTDGQNCTACGPNDCWDKNCIAPCAPGSHQIFMEELAYCSGCTGCAPGTYSTGYGEKVCQNCPKGKFQNQSGKTSCRNCEVGYYNPLVGQRTCLECPAGFYCNATDTFPCPSGEYCPPGSSSPHSCQMFYKASGDSLGCKPTWEFFAVIAGSCLAAVLIIFAAVFQWHRRKNNHTYQALDKTPTGAPLYTGL